jgi:predicted negative regulator of RcsB-dependent stress response
MRVLQRLYLAQGRRGDAEAMYRDVLAHTRDPGLRNFAYGQLARLQMMPTDTGAAIATLRQALNENLQQIKPPPAPAS